MLLFIIKVFMEMQAKVRRLVRIFRPGVLMLGEDFKVLIK